ncbi:MAG TPA: hypothetical protein VKD91_04555 [Pyrinomonadaceae bacterium]|nr:hypothetical protein [Pyrinomonadaceae bacterium]
MNSKECRNVRCEIDNSELGQRLSAQGEAHIASCQACAQFRLERGELRELIGSLNPVAAPADFDLRLRARMAHERESRARQPFIFRFALTTPGIAVAAALVLIVAAAVWINQRYRKAPSPSAPLATTKDQAPAPANNSNASSNALTEEPKRDEVAASKSPDPGKRSTPLVRNPKSQIVPPASQDFSARQAQSFSLRPERDGEVSLAAPSKPLVVSVEDANGTKHKILLPPVSFGSQRFDTRTPVSMTNRKDW